MGSRRWGGALHSQHRESARTPPGLRAPVLTLCLRRVLPGQGHVCTRASQAHSPGTAVLTAGGVQAVGGGGAVDLASGQMNPEKRGLFQGNSKQGQETGRRGANRKQRVGPRSCGLRPGPAARCGRRVAGDCGAEDAAGWWGEGVGGRGTLEPGTGVRTKPENESSPSGAPQGRDHVADLGQHVF